MNEHYPFVNPPLPYDYNAMEPFIDEKTMRLHHDRHLQTYVDNLNSALKDYPEYQNWPLNQLLMDISLVPESIRTSVNNNAGGVFNHILYFINLANPALTMPLGNLYEAILKAFGSYETFREQLKAAALSVFGSGYAWLVVDKNGQLKIITTANQNTPLPLSLHPVLNLDVWEHAYYLKHYNVRADYIDNWFHIINWDMANLNYQIFFTKEK